MPRGKKRALIQEEVVPQPRRSLRSIRKIPVQTIVISDEDDEIVEDDFESVKQPQQQHQHPKKQKISLLKNQIRPFSSTTTPQPTRSPTPDKSFDVSEHHNDQWIDKYAPKTVEEVSIHAKKLEEVRHDMKEMIMGNSFYKMLVLSGPAGSSKSTIASCLAKQLIPEIRQTQPSDTDVIEFSNDDSSGSTVTQFGEFLNSVKYRNGKNLSLILVEDLPNVFHAPTRESFQRALNEWIYADMNIPPLILCITECEFVNDGASSGYNIDNNYTVETILGRKLLMNPKVKRIKFNPINVTLSKKCLNHIVNKENKLFNKIPKQEIIDKIKELSEFGDIRSCISAFQFWATYRAHHVDYDKLPSFGKEPSISLFHAIGKCIFGTKNEGEDDNSTMDKVLKDFISKPNILKLGILENYTKYNKSNYDLASACDVAENLSFADLLSSDDSSIEIAARGTRTIFRNMKTKLSSSTSNHAGATFPREWKVLSSINTTKHDITRYMETEFRKRQAYRSFQDSNLIYGFYEPLINKQRGFKNKAKLHYLRASNKEIPKELLVSSNTFISERLGGPFKEIFGDGDPVADEEIIRDSYFEANRDDTWESSDDSEFDEDPIVDTDDDDGFGEDDTFERELVNLSQKPAPLLKSVSTLSSTSKSRNAEFLDDFEHDDFDDPDF